MQSVWTNEGHNVCLQLPYNRNSDVHMQLLVSNVTSTLSGWSYSLLLKHAPRLQGNPRNEINGQNNFYNIDMIIVYFTFCN